VTLIIGIKCKEGIVVASDGAATMGSFNQSTLIQPLKKLTIIDGKVIVGVSGSVGLGQKIVASVDRTYKDNLLSGKDSIQAMKILSEKIRDEIRPEFEAAAMAQKCLGNGALTSAFTTTLIALPVKRIPSLFQFDQQGSSEESTEGLPFVSIGSGEQIADPFLGFVKKIFWKDGLPSVNGGVFAALWTLEHVTLIHPGGVAKPLQIVVLKEEGGNWAAKELCETELVEHYEAIEAAEKTLSDFSKQLETPECAEEVPSAE
jgi:hypothetical protein